jgi:hypothetical protein
MLLTNGLCELSKDAYTQRNRQQSSDHPLVKGPHYHNLCIYVSFAFRSFRNLSRAVVASHKYNALCAFFLSRRPIFTEKQPNIYCRAEPNKELNIYLKNLLLQALRMS